MVAGCIQRNRVRISSMVMKFDETIERQNFLYWYSTAIEEDLKTAESLHAETFRKLMSKYAKEIKLIDILVHGKLNNAR